jgi:hypothetical protein
LIKIILFNNWRVRKNRIARAPKECEFDAPITYKQK